MSGFHKYNTEGMSVMLSWHYLWPDFHEIWMAVPRVVRSMNKQGSTIICDSPASLCQKGHTIKKKCYTYSCSIV